MVHLETMVIMMIATVLVMVEVVVIMMNTMVDMGELKDMEEEMAILVVMDIIAGEADEVDLVVAMVAIVEEDMHVEEVIFNFIIVDNIVIYKIMNW